jgi:protein SCO1/2
VAVSLIATLALALAAAAATDPPPATPAAPQETPPMTDEAIAREYFSDLPLLTHDGREVRFFSDLLQDHVVLISSFYTHCKGVSPRQNQVLLRLQEMLGESLGREVFIISITVDPERDTVETLKEYVKEIDPHPGWIFLTGKSENIDWVNHRLGQYLEDLEDHKGIYLAGNVGTIDLYRAIQRLLEDQGEPADG